MRFFLSLFFFLIFISCSSNQQVFHGYIEGDYLYISAGSAGILRTLSVKQGQQVRAGDPLFALDDIAFKAMVLAAEAEISKAQSQLDNLLKGKRWEEIKVIEKNRDHAQVLLEATEKEFSRAQSLMDLDAISHAEYDQAEANYKSAQTQLGAMEAQLRVAHLGSRQDEVKAARSALEIAKQKWIQLNKQLEDSAPRAPLDSYVENTFYQTGEFVPLGKAVVSLLPQNHIKVRFFISQKRLPEFRLGTEITIHCDGCKTPIPGKISFISSQAEYTPPVIYSTESREKLVYLVEGLPDPSLVSSLHPGLPVEIEVRL